VDVTPVIHQALQEKELLPTEHLTDTNYAEAKQFVQSREQYGIDLIAPTRADHKWQAKEQQGFDTSQFQIDWEAQKATCPAGCESLSWTPAMDRYDKEAHQNQVFDERLQAMSTQRALYQSPTPCDLRAHQATPSGLTRSQGTSKRDRVPGEIPLPIRHRRHHFESGFAPLGCGGAATAAWRKPTCNT
jgi:hypothetical protein